MKSDVIHFIKSRHLIKQNKTVLVGVSGGPDSMALLHILNSIKESYHLQLIALCINHQLRGEEAQKELLYVKDMCHRWDIPFIEEKIDVKSYKEQSGKSIQMAARDLRYNCYKKHLKEQNAHYLALGHHGDDQIETMFMTLSQVASSSALLGIPVTRPFGTGELIRPLLCVTRDDILNYCQLNDISPQFDSSNEDEHYMRIYYRKQIVPKIKERNNNIHKTIQHLSESLSDDESFLMDKAKELFESNCIVKQNSDKLTVIINKFRSYPISLQRRVYQLILDYLYEEIPKNLSYIHERDFLSLLNDDKGNLTLDFPNMLQVEKSYNNIYFYFNKEEEQSYFHKVVDLPSVIHLPNGATLTFSFIDKQIDDEDKYTYSCSVNDISFPIHIRTRLPGDKMRWKGLKGSKKIKDIFIDEKVPRHERDKKLLITDNNDTVLWLIGLKKGLPKINETKNHSNYIKIIYQEG